MSLSQGLIIEIVIAIIFVLGLGIYVYKNRQHATLQKIAFPFLYIYLLRKSWGIKLMQKVGTKYQEAVKLFGYIGIGVGFSGMVVMIYLFILVLIEMLKNPNTPAVAPVLPFTNVPGVGFLGFSHWLIALVFLVVVHEFAHGMVAKAHGIKIKSSGLAVMGVLLPIFPAAFVEPDDKQLHKQSDVVQYSIFAAGPFMNILWFVVFILILSFVFNPMFAGMTEPVGFSFNVAEGGGPAALAGLGNLTLINQFNGKPIDTADPVLNKVYYGIDPGESIRLGYKNDSTGTTLEYVITTDAHPDDESRAYIGIQNIVNERRFKDSAKGFAPLFLWLMELCRWLAILNFAVGTINLLPMLVTDGGQMFHLAATKLVGPKKAAKASTMVGMFMWGIIILGLVLWFVGLF